MYSYCWIEDAGSLTSYGKGTTQGLSQQFGLIHLHSYTEEKFNITFICQNRPIS